MRKHFVIYSQTETEHSGENSFWSNTDGWGSLSSATIFNDREKETTTLPATSPDHPSQWIELPSSTKTKTTAAFSIENLTIYRRTVALSTKLFDIKSVSHSAVHNKVVEISLALVMSIAAGLGFWEKQWKLVHLNSARRLLLELPALLELMVAVGDLTGEKEAALNDDIREIMTELNNVIRMVKKREDNEIR